MIITITLSKNISLLYPLMIIHGRKSTSGYVFWIQNRSNHHRLLLLLLLYLFQQKLDYIHKLRGKRRIKEIQSLNLGRGVRLRSKMATSWVKTITSPFKKACTFLNHQPPRDKKSKQGNENRGMEHLHGEVMACAYEDVQVMWSMLDKSKPRTSCNLSSWPAYWA